MSLSGEGTGTSTDVTFIGSDAITEVPPRARNFSRMLADTTLRFSIALIFPEKRGK